MVQMNLEAVPHALKELDLALELDPMVFYTANQLWYLAVGVLEGLVLLDELFPVSGDCQLEFVNGASLSSLVKYVAVSDAVILIQRSAVDRAASGMPTGSTISSDPTGSLHTRLKQWLQLSRNCWGAF